MMLKVITKGFEGVIGSSVHLLTLLQLPYIVIFVFMFCWCFVNVKNAKLYAVSNQIHPIRVVLLIDYESW